MVRKKATEYIIQEYGGKSQGNEREELKVAVSAVWYLRVRKGWDRRI